MARHILTRHQHARFPRLWRQAFATLGIVAAVVASPGSSTRASADPGRTTGFGTELAGAPTVWDAVYTNEQAKRGEAGYMKHCVSCHKSDLLGDNDYTQPLIGPIFMFRWKDKSVGQLYEKARTMPADYPDTLTPQEYVDLLSYFLSVNGFPAGPTELPADAEKLKLITVLENRPK